MGRSTCLFGLSLVLIAAGSCMFQNDPARPNSPPEISSYMPRETYIDFEAPDSCLFAISAIDVDSDRIDYSFVAGDSLLAAAESVMFRAMIGGVYRIEGRASDGAGTAVHVWNVRVFSHANEPPVITAYSPLETQIARAVGDTLRFAISVSDDNPGALLTSFDIRDGDGTFIEKRSGVTQIDYRFLESGSYRVSGVVWDGQYGDTTSWSVTVTGFPDTIPPAAIHDLEGETGDEAGTVRLRWIAPGDDDTWGTAVRYEVRTATKPILTQEDWAKASPKNGTPAPSPAGSVETMTVYNLNPGTDIFVMVRAIDDFFNMSPLGADIMLLVRGFDVSGRVLDLVTGGPVPGIVVSAEDIADTSDAAGNYILPNLPYYTTQIRARDEGTPGPYGEWYDFSMRIIDFTDSFERDIGLIPVLGLVNTIEPYHYDHDFLLFLKGVTATDGRFGAPTVFRGWNHWPLAVYNPPKIVDDVDLQAAVSGALAEWEAMTGYDLFVEAADAETADIVIAYDDINVYKHHYETNALNPDGTPKQRTIWIYTGYTGVPITILPHLVYAHELGHCIAFVAHSMNLGHLMIGNTLPQQRHVTEDEANVVRIIYNAPPIVDFGEILFD